MGGGWEVVTVVRRVGTTVEPIVVLPRVVLQGTLWMTIRILVMGMVDFSWIGIYYVG